MVVVEPLEINNEAACSLKVLSHLRSNKRKREREKKEERNGGRAKRIVIETAPSSSGLYSSSLLSLSLSPYLSLSCFCRSSTLFLFLCLSSSLAREMMTARASSRREGQNHNKANN